ncbi:iron complex transport system substrate-binding protein [Geodermatophilus bullaregiensis]|uniref:siderophore ABC transporter substrate-binding protein n=1 Tax=Geodermatophilus bullaregiensis TaxID=1564160 RepID=UPI0019585584|nr:siderophore ABC transporter substrate-binding protein [Geodermatophilus bullaregiensis]MBM7806536.1 iron complex transport system substrate-binding protein [Geodermatophilus bullaregiensis]
MRTPSRPMAALSLTVATALAVSACGGDTTAEASSESAEVTVAHAQGETAVPADPQTVVVFDVGVLSTLDSLGVEVAGVPEATYPESLAQYGGDEYAKVGSLFEPDYEAVDALEPDLIVVGGRSAAVYPELAEIAPTIDLTVDNGDFLASFEERVTTLAEVFGEEDAVADRLAALDQRVAEVRETAAGAGDALFVMTNAGEVSAYGPETRFGMVYSELGLTPTDEALTAADHGDAISFEYIAEKDPDILLVLDRDAAIGESGTAAQQVLDNELVRGTTAWQDDDVHHLDSSVWYIAPNGLPSVEQMVEEVAAAVE